MQPDESRRSTAIPWTADGLLEVLVFDLGGQSFALEAVLVREILDMMPETTVPGAPPLVAHVLNFRGRIIPLADLRLAFGMPVTGATLDSLLAEWAERLGALAEAGVPDAAMTLATGFGRAFGYYDGVLFEVWSEALGPDDAVAAGGRYDSLLRRMGASGTASATGCMVRPARAWYGAV